MFNNDSFQHSLQAGINYFEDLLALIELGKRTPSLDNTLKIQALAARLGINVTQRKSMDTLKKEATTQAKAKRTRSKGSGRSVGGGGFSGRVSTITDNTKQFKKSIKNVGMYTLQIKAEGKHYSGLTNAHLLAMNENGSPLQGIPARPVVQNVLKENKKFISQTTAEAMRLEKSGKTTQAYQLLKALGDDLVQEVRENIDDGISPPLSPLTIKYGRKPRIGEDKPLLVTGALRKSIRAKVVRNAG